MRPLSRNCFSVRGLVRWLLDLAIWLLARSLQMPEPLLHSTGVFLVAQVQAVEDSFGKTLCPIRLFRRLLALCRW